MKQGVIVALIGTAILGLGLPPAQAGPCSKDIAAFEQAVRQSANNPDAGPLAPQSVAAQLDRQPTPGSIKRAEQRSQSAFEAALARSKRLDARGDRVGCTKALVEAKQLYQLN